MLKKFINRPFVKNVMVMATGTAAAQGVYLLVTPFITRIYGPEIYGLMGIFMSVAGIVTPIAALTYPIAIVLPKNNSVAIKLMKLSLIIAFIISIIFSLILILFKEDIVNLFQLNNIESFLYLVPLIIILSGFLQVSENWLIRTKQFKITAKVTFFQAICLQGAMVLIGLIYPGASVLIVISVLGVGLKASMMIIFARKQELRVVRRKESEISMIELAREYKDFPRYRAPEVFVNAISLSLPILLLAVFFGPTSAGFYTICRTVLSVPGLLIGKSVGDVFYPRISEAAKNKENLTKLILKTTLSLGAIGILPYALVVGYGPELFSLVFGSEWRNAGEYARWIALWSFFGFMNKPSVISLPVLGAQGFQLFYTIFMLIVRVVALGAGYYFFKSDVVAVAFFGVSGAILNVGLIVIVNYISKRYDVENKKLVKE